MQTKEIVVQIIKSGSNRTKPENFIEKTINPEMYGYKPVELYPLINNNIVNKASERTCNAD